MMLKRIDDFLYSLCIRYFAVNTSLFLSILKVVITFDLTWFLWFNLAIQIALLYPILSLLYAFVLCIKSYIWTPSRFTRVQRLTCCVTFLLSWMCINAMWYGTVRESVDLYVGFKSYSYEEIIVGIISSLMVFPVNFIIIMVFRNCRLPASRVCFKISTLFYSLCLFIL